MPQWLIIDVTVAVTEAPVHAVLVVTDAKSNGEKSVVCMCLPKASTLFQLLSQSQHCLTLALIRALIYAVVHLLVYFVPAGKDLV